MKYLGLFILLVGTSTLFAQAPQTEGKESVEKINWMTWDEAYKANQKEPKKIFIDIYTEWCGWCKKMDSSTFVDPSIVKEMNEDFYAVKFDAEQKEEIKFNGATFSFVKQGRRGSHQLAYALLDGRMSYPSFVLLDEKFQRIMLAPGYKTPEKLMPQLQYTSTEAYKTQNFDKFSQIDK